MCNVRPHHWRAYLALVAMLFATLMPSLSFAMPVVFADNVDQAICTTQGPSLVVQVFAPKANPWVTAPPLKSSPQPNALHGHLKHCPFCQLAFDHVLLPSPHPAYVLFQQTQQRIAPCTYQAPVVASVDLSAHPSRAPPALSIP